MHAHSDEFKRLVNRQRFKCQGICLFYCYALVLLVSMWTSVIIQATQWNSHHSISNCGKCMDLQRAAGNDTICNHDLQSCEFSFWRCSEDINKFIIKNQFGNQKRSLYAINERNLVLEDDEYVDFNKTVHLKDAVNSKGFENDLTSAFICSLILAILTTILGICIGYYLTYRYKMFDENLRGFERNRDAFINIQDDESPTRSCPFTWSLSSYLLCVTILFSQMAICVTFKASIPQLIEMKNLERYNLNDILFNTVSCMHTVVGYDHYDTTKTILWCITLGFIFSSCLFGLLYYCGIPKNSFLSCCGAACGSCAVFLGGFVIMFFLFACIGKLRTPVPYMMFISSGFCVVFVKAEIFNFAS